MNFAVETVLIAVFTSAACAVAGTFLMLRKMSMTADSITHTILLGIALGFFLTGDLNSPILIIGATAVGAITVWLTELLSKTRLVKEDSATGIIFPLLFSIAVILISKYAGNAHLDTDSVLLGELAFAPFDRLIVGGIDVGAKGVYLSGAVLIINIALATVFYKEIRLVSFDPLLAAVMGFSPAAVHYGLVTCASLTAVASFETAGSVLLTAFMTAPAAAAYLLTEDLREILFLSVFFGALSAILGFRTAMLLELSIAGCIAVWCGIFFFAAAIFSFAKNKRGRSD